MRRAEILDAQVCQCYGKGNLGSKLHNELRYKQSYLEKIRQARKEMEAETGAAAANTRPVCESPTACGHSESN